MTTYEATYFTECEMVMLSYLLQLNHNHTFVETWSRRQLFFQKYQLSPNIQAQPTLIMLLNWSRFLVSLERGRSDPQPCPSSHATVHKWSSLFQQAAWKPRNQSGLVLVSTSKEKSLQATQLLSLFPGQFVRIYQVIQRQKGPRMLKVSRNALHKLAHRQRKGTSHLSPRESISLQTELQPGLKTTFEIKEFKAGESSYLLWWEYHLSAFSPE